MLADDIAVLNKVFTADHGDSEVEGYHIGQVLGVGSIKRVVVDGLAVEPEKLLDGADRGNAVTVRGFLKCLYALGKCFGFNERRGAGTIDKDICVRHLA